MSCLLQMFLKQVAMILDQHQVWANRLCKVVINAITHSLLQEEGHPHKKTHWYSQTVLGYKRDKPPLPYHPLKECQERQNMQNWWKINGNTQECWTLHQMKITAICCCTPHNGGMHHHNSPTFKPFLQWSNLANSMSLLGAYNSATSSIVVDATK